MNEQTAPAASYPLRLPPALKKALQREAEREHRSLNAHIIHVLSEHISAAAVPDPGKEP